MSRGDLLTVATLRLGLARTSALICTRGTRHLEVGRDKLVVMTEPHDLPKGIGAPATRALVGAGYTSIEQLAGADASKLAALHGVGPKALRIIAETLAERGAAPMTDQ